MDQKTASPEITINEDITTTPKDDDEASDRTKTVKAKTSKKNINNHNYIYKEKGSKKPLAGWLYKRYPFGFSSRRFCCLLGTQFLVCKDENLKNIDIIFDMTPDIQIDIINNSGEKSARFTISDRKKQSITLEAANPNQMMQWILQLRSCIFQNKKMSLDNFNIISVIGRGFYGKVMLVEDPKKNEYFAIKSIRKEKLVGSNDKIKTVLAERNILSMIEHPFIIDMKFAFQTVSKFYLGLEYAPGGELFHRMQQCQNLPINEVKLYIAEICLAIDYLHKNHIMYRDLKPENILLDSEGYIKLTDFGMAKEINETTSTFCGTPEYLAPELVKHQSYGYSADWWAVGILTFELIYGHTPFANENRSKLYQNIVSNEPQFPKKSISKEKEDEIISFISLLLEKDPNQRPGFDSGIKEHPFFDGINFDDLHQKKIKPPFVPMMTNEATPNNFDTEFTSESAADSFTTPVFGDLMDVPGFSYTDKDFGKSERICDFEYSEPEVISGDHPSKVIPVSVF